MSAMNEQVTVLVLGNDEDLMGKLDSDLGFMGYTVLPGKYPDIEIDVIARQAPDIILLLLTSRDETILPACETLVQEDTLPPKTALIALMTENIMGFITPDLSFSDIIVVPYNRAELDFRLRRVLDRYHRNNGTNVITIDDLTISLDSYEVRIDGKPVLFSLKEYKLLKYLVTHPGCVFTRDVLLSNVWEFDYLGGTRTVDVHIRRIRAKIGDLNEDYIKTVRGVGYVFRPGRE
jgi:DNA-binding response OmpR family regulator